MRWHKLNHQMLHKYSMPKKCTDLPPSTFLQSPADASDTVILSCRQDLAVGLDGRTSCVHFLPTQLAGLPPPFPFNCTCTDIAPDDQATCPGEVRSTILSTVDPETAI